MAIEHETGNPVFDFRADYRRTSDAIQWTLIKYGASLMLAGCVARVFVGKDLHASACIAASIGALGLVAGIAFGFYWHWRLRVEFRDNHGMDSMR